MRFTHLLEEQKQYLEKKGSLTVTQRIEALTKLKQAIKKHESQLEEALKKDLGKPQFESYTTEIGFLYNSINHTIKHLKKWAKPKRVRTDVAQLIGKAYVYPAAYGSVLIIGPFNYPVQLLLEPLVGAIAGGNTAVLKPSELTPHVEAVLVKLIQETFDESYIAIVTGGVETNQALLSLPFDYIFFTGSVRVGKIVMERASHQLIPVTLELGGKSPVIVDETANLKLAAERIAWGKFMNTGQTCVAPDYVLVHQSIYDDFLNELQKAVIQFYGHNPKQNPDYGRIVTTAHTERLIRMIDENENQIVMGGEYQIDERYVSPTVFKNTSIESTLMEEELFGPLLPTMSYQTLEDIDCCLKKHPKPLAFYVFSEKKSFSETLIHRYAFGGGCINDTLTHVASTYLPFGGVGTSGIGRYHGEASFKTFTYEKAIVKRSTKISVNLAFPPYKNQLKMIKKIMK